MAWYIDTSAFLKLLVAEEESAALRAWLTGHEPVWSSHLLRTEALRAAGRLGVDPEVVEQALATVFLVLPGSSTFATAGRLSPPGLRSLDALHLASALELGSDLQGLLTYDLRVSEGARELAIAVLAPS
ncbi:MAG TPA: type II toxin-antitoxin system VapC family toxin [Actinomycetota bacterium]|nr:type II toxin-antitoxin system VapC family toxin [Actinomycetota bacterium]